MFKIKIYSFLFEIISALFFNCWAIALIRTDQALQDLARSFGIFLLTQSALQIPTGIFADKVGRKVSLSVGLLMTAMGCAQISFFHQPWVGFLVIGAGFSFIDGAKSAWLRDISNFQAHKKTDTSYYFSIDLVARIATAFSSYFGIKLANLNVDFFWSAIIVLCFLVLGIISFEKTSPVVESSSESHRRFKLSIPFLIFILTGVFYGLEYGLRNLVSQVYVDRVSQGNEKIFGYFFITLSTARICGLLMFKKIPPKLKENFPVLLFVPLFVFGCAQINAGFTSSFVRFLIGYASAVFFLGIFFPIRETLLNRLVSDKWRATALSIDSMVYLTTAGLLLLNLSGSEALDVSKLWIVSGTSIIVAGVGYALSAKLLAKSNT